MTISATPNQGYPWPNNDEPVSNGWDAIRDLAVAVDLDVNRSLLIRMATKAVDQAFPNASVFTLATFDTYVGDTGITAPTSARLAAPTPGTYRWAVNYFTESNLNAYYHAQVKKNSAGSQASGTRLGIAQQATPAAIPAGYGVQLAAHGLVSMATNDYVETFLRHNFAAAVSLTCQLTLEYVSP